MRSHAKEDAATTLEQLVRVLAVTEDGRAWVEPVSGGCGRCHEKEGCGKTHLTRMFGSPRRFLVDNPARAQPGEEAIVTIPQGGLLRQGILVYLFPLAALLLGAAAGKYLAGETGGVVGGIFAFAASFWVLPKIWKRPLTNPAFAAKIAKVVDSSSGGKSCG